MAVAELSVSRREVLGAACAAPLSLCRHPGLDPGSLFAFRRPLEGRGIPDQVRNDGWERTLDRVRAAEAALDAARGADDAVFDRVLGRFNRALARLLRTPAPDIAALAVKLDLLLAHEVWELDFAQPCLAALRRDAARLAGAARAKSFARCGWPSTSRSQDWPRLSPGNRL
jgi:hypothetical protein